MRFAVSMRPLAPVALFAFVSLAYLGAAVFAFAHVGANQGRFWLALGALAAGCAANATASRPLAARAFAAWLFPRRFDGEAAAPAARYVLSDRIKVALQAAARARR